MWCHTGRLRASATRDTTAGGTAGLRFSQMQVHRVYPLLPHVQRAHPNTVLSLLVSLSPFVISLQAAVLFDTSISFDVITQLLSSLMQCVGTAGHSHKFRDAYVVITDVICSVGTSWNNSESDACSRCRRRARCRQSFLNGGLSVGGWSIKALKAGLIKLRAA